jgi:hypothetical protein
MLKNIYIHMHKGKRITEQSTSELLLTLHGTLLYSQYSNHHVQATKTKCALQEMKQIT